MSVARGKGSFCDRCAVLSVVAVCFVPLFAVIRQTLGLYCKIGLGALNYSSCCVYFYTMDRDVTAPLI